MVTLSVKRCNCVMLCSESKLQHTLICHLLCLYYSTAGLSVFVLHMRSPNLFFDVSDCSEYVKNFTLPPQLFNQTAYGYRITAVGQNFTCERYDINYYIHIHVQENREDKENTLKEIQILVNSEVQSRKSFVQFLKQHQINRSDLSIRSTVACQEENFLLHEYRTTWPTTLMGQSAQSEELCVGANGKVIERECLGDFNTGAFWSPIQGECVDVSSELTVDLHKLSKIQITKFNILNTSLKMAALTSTSKDMRSADVQYVAQILRNMAVVPTFQHEVFRSVFSTVDNVIGIEHLRREFRNFNVSSKILFAVENMLSHFYTNSHVFKAAGNNLALSLFSYGGNMSLVPTGGILESWNSSMTTFFNGTGNTELLSAFDEFEAGILLPENVLLNGWREIGEDVAIAIYKNFRFVENFDVVSLVIDVFVASRPTHDVDPPIQLMFKVPEMEQNTSYECVFWDQTSNDNCGGWSNKGCISHYLDKTHMCCSCDHLTSSFAVISDHRSNSEKYIIIFAKSALYTGWISFQFGLLTIILTFILFRQYRKKLKHKVLFNLSLSLFVFMLTLSAGLERRNSTVVGCSVVAAILHYFLLTSLAWMVVEAFVQYHILVKVIGTYIPRFMQKASLFGWGVPLLNIIVLLSTDYKIYITGAKLCWPKVWVIDKAFYYGVVAQAATMWVMTFVVFVLILKSTCRKNMKGLRTHQNERKAKIARYQAIFCVSVLLGVSWLYGVVNVYANYFAIQYIYAAVLTLLGIFIFIYFVFLCKETRKLWLSLFINTTITPEISHIDVSTSPAESSTNTRNNC